MSPRHLGGRPPVAWAMTVLRALPVTLLLIAATAAPAVASYGPPVELASGGGFGTSVVSATDAAGATTALVQGEGAPRLFERAGANAAWGPPAPVPGRALEQPKGPVIAAAGDGAAAMAWRVDQPRRYAGIVAIVRAPGDLFSAPALVSDADANGVRHPAVAVDGEGRALLAFNTNTRAVHLSLKGAIAVSLRGAHGSFGAPQVVDERPGSPPAVAIGPDGRGVVAWLRDRRVWAVSVDVEAGSIGRVTALTGVGVYDAVRAAAGPGGAATIAFVARGRDARTGGGAGTAIAVLRRPAGARFPRRAQAVATVDRRRFVDTLALAGDADGQATVAWSPETFGGKGVGINGVTSEVQAAVAPAGARRFGRAVVVAPHGRLLCDPPVVAAAAGRAAIAFACRDRATWQVAAATIDRGGPTPSQIVMRTTPSPNLFYQRTPVSVGIDDAGIATVLAARPDPADPAKPTEPTTQRVLVSTGR